MYLFLLLFWVTLTVFLNLDRWKDRVGICPPPEFVQSNDIAHISDFWKWLLSVNLHIKGEAFHHLKQQLICRTGFRKKKEVKYLVEGTSLTGCTSPTGWTSWRRTSTSTVTTDYCLSITRKFPTLTLSDLSPPSMLACSRTIKSLEKKNGIANIISTSNITKLHPCAGNETVESGSSTQFYATRKATIDITSPL